MLLFVINLIIQSIMLYSFNDNLNLINKIKNE